MFCGVSLLSCFSTNADKSLTVITFTIIMFTIIAQAITAVNSTVNSHSHTESFSKAAANSAVWVSESIVEVESERTNNPTYIRARSIISFHGLRSLTSSHSTGSATDLLESDGRWTADRHPETPTVQQYGILAEYHSRTTAVFNAEKQSQSVQVGVLSTASEFSNPNGLRQRLDSRIAVNEVNNNKVTAYYNSKVKSFISQHLTKPSMDTSSGYHSAYVTQFGKSVNSDYGITSVDESVVTDSVSKKLDASWKDFIVTLIKALVTAVQIRFAALSQALETLFDVHSPAKPPPETKTVPVKPVNTLLKRTKRSNFPELLSEDNQSSIIAVTKPNESMITPSSVDIPPVTTANPLHNPLSLLDKDKSKKSPFNSQKVVPKDPENFGRSFETLDIRNKKPFINSSQEQDLMSWFGGVSPVLGAAQVNSSASNTSNLVYENKTELALLAPDGHIPCNGNCSRRQGVCVMGNDFQLHCVVVDDACEHFPCTNGE